jgi:hypothetical protein
MTTYLVPIEGLTLVEPWHVGTVRLHTSASLDSLVTSTATHLLDHKVIGKVSRETVEEMSRGTVAQVDAADIDAAIDLVAVATDILRVFQRIQRNTYKTTMFGLPGQLYRSTVRYLTLGEKGGIGFRNRGEALGWTFDEEAHAAWNSSPTFTSLASLVGATGPFDDGLRRALIGVQLLSRAILEHRPAFKILNLVIGLESMLLERLPQSQGFRLARRASYFTCGRWNNSLCGRDRPSCQCLALDPGREKDRRSLKRVQRLAEIDTRWRCAEWLDYLCWYDLRSSVAHGDDAAVDERAVSSAEYWIMRWTAEPVLLWLLEHPNKPLVALDDAIAALPVVPRWQDPVPDPATYDPGKHDFSH